MKISIFRLEEASFTTAERLLSNSSNLYSPMDNACLVGE
jgi:hypothetical protein